jgi:hypothetical protein
VSDTSADDNLLPHASASGSQAIPPIVQPPSQQAGLQSIPGQAANMGVTLPQATMDIPTSESLTSQAKKRRSVVPVVELEVHKGKGKALKTRPRAGSAQPNSPVVSDEGNSDRVDTETSESESESESDATQIQKSIVQHTTSGHNRQSQKDLPDDQLSSDSDETVQHSNHPSLPQVAGTSGNQLELDNSSLEDTSTAQASIPSWANPPPVNQRGIQTSADLLQSFRPCYLATNDELPSQVLHNAYAQSLALRNLPDVAASHKKHGTGHDLANLAIQAQATMDELKDLRKWFLETLVKKLKIEIESGAEALSYTLGPTVQVHKVSQLTRMVAHMLISRIGFICGANCICNRAKSPWYIICSCPE